MKTLLLSFVLFNLTNCISYSEPTSDKIELDESLINVEDSKNEVLYPDKFVINTRIVIEGAVAKPIGENIGKPVEQLWALTSEKAVQMLKDSEKHFSPINVEFHISRIDFVTYTGSFIIHRLDSIRHPEYMNIYFCLPNDLTYTGISTFPWEDFNRGIVLGYGVEASVLAHEIGHYFGLFHTFTSPMEDGEDCDDPLMGCTGDLVDDTPEQIENFCSVEGSPNCGNIMNYCHHKKAGKEFFTQGQYDRMRYCLSKYRLSNLLFSPSVDSLFNYGVPKNKTIEIKKLED